MKAAEEQGDLYFYYIDILFFFFFFFFFGKVTTCHSRIKDGYRFLQSSLMKLTVTGSWVPVFDISLEQVCSAEQDQDQNQDQNGLSSDVFHQRSQHHGFTQSEGCILPDSY